MKIGKNTLVFLISIAAIFIGLHLFGLDIPYHQDEYKWRMYAHPEILPPGSVPHPPLTEFIYTRLGPIVGDTHFRFIPFGFGLINLLLLYYFVRFAFSEKAARIATVVFTFSFYSLLASLMIDVDGAVMPFFLLLMLIGYFKWRGRGFLFVKYNAKWIALMLIGAIGGFLVKLSAVLPVAAVALDYAIENGYLNDKKKIMRYFAGALVGAVALVGILIGSKYIFPFFNLEYSLKYWEHFANSSSFLGRGWFQTAIQCIKALLYTSPVLVLIPFFMNKDEWRKLKVFYFFIAFAFIFYVILFDFSIGALDRYWQLLVLPLTVTASVVLARVLETKNHRYKEMLLLGAIVAGILVLLQSVPHFIPPLHPKSEWVTRIIHLRWNFVYPFSGGSGPIGFYVSFLFMALAWIVSIAAALFGLYKKQYKNLIGFFLIPLGFTYNAVFIEEYLFGLWNGSSTVLVEQTMDYIKNNPDIRYVTAYNDNGGNELQLMGKYRKRLYIDPKFDVGEKVASLNIYKEHYFVLDIPRIDPSTVYQKYFDSCTIVYHKQDKKIGSTIYDCRKAPDIKL